MNDKIPAFSYAGGAASVLSALTLSDVGILVGIITALGTFALTVFYKIRQGRMEARYLKDRDERERVQHALMLDALRSDRRRRDVPDAPSRRYCDRIEDCEHASDPTAR